MKTHTSSETIPPALNPTAAPPRPTEDGDQPALVHLPPPDEPGDAVENAEHPPEFYRLSTLCTQIKEQHQSFFRVYRRSLDEAIALGQLLDEARKLTPRGQWTAFLGEAGIGERPAQNYMQLYRQREVVLAAGPELNSALTISRALAAARQPRVAHPVETTPMKPPLNGDSAAEEAAQSYATASPDTQSEHLGESCAGAHDGDVRVDENIGSTHPVNAEVGSLDLAQDQEGHLFANGSRLPRSVDDDGPMAFEHVQRQLDALKPDNEEPRSGLQRGRAAIMVEQQCIVELSRAANRLFAVHVNTDEPFAQALWSAIQTVRNLVVPLVDSSLLAAKAMTGVRRDGFRSAHAGSSSRYPVFRPGNRAAGLDDGSSAVDDGPGDE